MNRLCIYVTYNRQCKICEYAGNVLKSLKECCSRLCLVCNYDSIEEGKEYADVYADDIFCRENKGYDSGAYKDVLCEILGWDEVRKYDELILANDSFFGFFYPLQNTFDLMDKQNCDFWGMTGQIPGEFSNPTYKFDAHVHSYFLVFKKKVLNSGLFRRFWEELVYPENFREAIINFEIGINTCLKEHGFQGISYIDIYDIRLKKNENPYYSRIDELIGDYRFPVMKKKCVLIRNAGFGGTLNVLDYLKKKNFYPTDWILTYLENQFYISGIGENPCNSLEIFYKKHSNVYIYGTGVCGKNLALYFDYKGWNYKGFIVTDYTCTDMDAIGIDSAQITDNTGIIISVINKKAADEIAEHIGERCKRSQLFFISDCNTIKLPE